MLKRIRMIVAPILLILSVLMVLFSDTLIHTINTTYHFDEVKTHTATVNGYESKNRIGKRGRTIYYTLVKVTLDDTNESIDFTVGEAHSKLEEKSPVGSKIDVYEFHNRYSSNLSSILKPPSYTTIILGITSAILLIITLKDYGIVFRND